MLAPTISTLSFLIPTVLSLCPPPGPILPPPATDTSSPNLNIPEAAFNNLTFLNDTSFAIKAAIGNTTIYQYEHSAPGREVSQSLMQTQIRIGSATKMITALALLLSKDKISLDDPITKFIPELHEELYGDVTIKSLTDHTSGLGRFGYVGDLAFQGAAVASALGLPNVTNTLPGCDPMPGGRMCTHEEVIAMFNNPAYAPYSPNARPMYSNIGYILLGKALETAHNQSYEEIIQDLVLDPVGMPLSTFTPPTNNQTALLPRSLKDADWFVPNFGNLNAAGGLWSTPNEMLKLLQALQNNALVSKSEMRKWLQPTIFLRSLQQAVGISWEIFRSPDFGLEFPRPVEIYTKAGGVPGYASYAVLIPEYDVSLTINLAGGSPNYPAIDLLATVAKYLVPYADELAREQAEKKYAGMYTFADGKANNTLVLSANDGPGLSVDSLIINGGPVLPALAQSRGWSLENFSARLYPTDPDSLGTDKENWRLLLDQNESSKKQWAELDCMSWNLGDFARYVGEPLDTFTFHVESGEVVGVELLGWRAKLNKVS